jgi:hypothetical protein
MLLMPHILWILATNTREGYRVIVDGQPDTKKRKASVDDLLGLPYE